MTVCGSFEEACGHLCGSEQPSCDSFFPLHLPAKCCLSFCCCVEDQGALFSGGNDVIVAYPVSHLLALFYFSKTLFEGCRPLDLYC